MGINMQIYELSEYAKEHWSQFRQRIAYISQNRATDEPLVQSDVLIYDFDEIVETLFDERNKPSSADGLFWTPHKIVFVEFKSGFYKKITKDNLNPEKAKCDYSGEFCKDYWKLFFDKQKKETNELIDSIKLKAVESYIIWEKNIAPVFSLPIQCDIEFIAVIDGNSEDGIEDALAELSNQGVSDNSCYRVRNALKRFLNRKDLSGGSYYYSNIQVMTPKEFEVYINRVLVLDKENC